MPLEATIDTPIEDAIQQLAETTTEALNEMKELRERFERFEAKAKRPGAPGDGFSKKAANDNIDFKAGGYANDNNPDFVEERKTLAGFVRNGEVKTMYSGSDPDGGLTNMPLIAGDITRRINNQSPIRNIARVVQVGPGHDSYSEPVQIGDSSAVWVGELESRGPTTTPTLGSFNVPLNELYSTQPVSQRLLDDNSVDIANFVMERAADKFARTEGAAFVNGNGVGKPKGFLSYTPDTADDTTRDRTKIQYVNSGSSSAVTFDGLKALWWSLRAPFRSNAAWVMSSSTGSQLDAIKDLEGRYVWRDASTQGAPPTLLGKPVYFCEDMPNVTGNAFPIALADWNKAYILADRPNIKWLRDPYSQKPLVQFYAYRRVGGGLGDSDAIKLMKIST